ncbi:COQ9 family protein [Cognatiyoonia sp.]|uniref:COQ9 family protein n=1 Tax=Cognatiyoonia sp. TaxID=2211652 RepID=UPI003F69A4FC
MKPPVDPVKVQLIDAILDYVAFDGWSQPAFEAAIADVGIDKAHAQTLFPRGAVDLAILYHQRGDDEMAAAMAQADLSEMRYSEKVAHAIWLRLEAITDKETVRHGTVLFALPHMAPDGAKLIWGTADRIWTVLGDTSDDINWYSKRATLSAVYSSVVLFWLGDMSEDHSATRAFIGRRIDNVMNFEKFKARVNNNPALKPITDPLSRMLGMIKAPNRIPDVDLPGMWRGDT